MKSAPAIREIIIAIVAFLLMPGFFQNLQANPNLAPGVWTDITPSAAGTSKQGFLALAIDYSNPNVLYAGSCGQGIWKTTNAGETWTQLGNSSMLGTNWATTSRYIDNPVFIEVDPKNSQHLYTCHTGWCGSGQTVGFWVSTDAGANWEMPAGFQAAAKLQGASTDVGGFVVDPGNFNHILISLHYTPDDQFGFLESTDGGATFIVHPYPMPVGNGTKGVTFLHSARYNIGSENTWLVTTEGPGFWRTSDAGKTWANVSSTFSGVHGGLREIYYTSSGMLYTGGYQYPTRSTDNGITWQQVKDGLYGYYGEIIGDGVNLYTAANQYLMTSPESDGSKWTVNKQFPHNPGLMRFDTLNHIMYATMFSTNGGIWALKTTAPSTNVASSITKKNADLMKGSSRMHMIMNGISVSSSKSTSMLYDIRGKAIDRNKISMQAVIIKK